MGFIPAKGPERKTSLADIASCVHTVVFFEAPHRIRRTFEELVELPGQGERRCVCCRELTKMHENISQGTVQEMIERMTSSDSESAISDEVSWIYSEI